MPSWIMISLVNYFLDCPSFFILLGWRGRLDFYAQLGGRGCTCKNFEDDYEWSETPSSSWNAYDTCKKLNGRRVLLIGDSTMGQLGTTLMNALHPAGCQINITCVEIDTLVNKEMGHMNRGPHWMDCVKQNEGWADIVIISAGPHIYGRTNFNLVVDSVINGTLALKRTTQTWRWYGRHSPQLDVLPNPQLSLSSLVIINTMSFMRGMCIV